MHTYACIDTFILTHIRVYIHIILYYTCLYTLDYRLVTCMLVRAVIQTVVEACADCRFLKEELVIDKQSFILNITLLPWNQHIFVTKL